LKPTKFQSQKIRSFRSKILQNCLSCVESVDVGKPNIDYCDFAYYEFEYALEYLGNNKLDNRLFKYFYKLMQCVNNTISLSMLIKMGGFINADKVSKKQTFIF
jgi:hypothetical protein